MKKGMMVVFAIAAVALVAEAAESTWTVSATVRRPSIEDGEQVHLKLIVAGGRCTDPEPGAYTASGKLKDGAAHLEIEDVFEGRYTACAFVDLVKRDGPPSFDSGDMGATKDFEVTGDTTLDIGEDAWTPQP